MLPHKKAIVAGLLVFALGIFIYNKVPQVRKVLGGAA